MVLTWLLYPLGLVGLLLFLYRHFFILPQSIKLASLPPKSDPATGPFLPRQKNRILVTGGVGALGKKLVNCLLTENSDFVEHVVVLDMAVPTTKNSDPRVTYIKGDITDYACVLAASKDCQVVFHVASYIDLRSKARHWAKVHNINIVGTQNVIEACVKNNVSALVYTGSSSSRIDCDSVKKYGDKFRTCENKEGKNNIFDFPEDELISFYGKSKCLAERATITANGRGNLRTAAVLPSVIVGTDDRYWFDWIYHRSLVPQKQTTIVQQRNQVGTLSISYNVSVSRLHILCARALVDSKRRDEIGGQSFFSVDFYANRWTFVDDVEKSLISASKLKGPIGFRHMNPLLVSFCSAAANIIDWFYDGNTRHEFFQLLAVYAVIGYGVGDLRCDASKAEKLLGFKPANLETVLKESAQSYCN